MPAIVNEKKKYFLLHLVSNIFINTTSNVYFKLLVQIYESELVQFNLKWLK